MSLKDRGLAIVSLLVLAIGVSACCAPCSWITERGITWRGITGSGRLITEELDYQGFTKLEISSAFEVELTQSSEYRVVVTTDDNVVDDLRVDVVGDTLRIGLRPTIGLSNVTLRAEVSMPILEGLELSGASRLDGEMETGDVRFELSGASRLILDGAGGDLRLNASGASQVDLSGFQVGDADVEVSGASQATVYVTGRLDAEASGASQVRYLGDPTLGRIDTSGASTVSPAR